MRVEFDPLFRNYALHIVSSPEDGILLDLAVMRKEVSALMKAGVGWTDDECREFERMMKDFFLARYDDRLEQRAKRGDGDGMGIDEDNLAYGRGDRAYGREPLGRTSRRNP